MKRIFALAAVLALSLLLAAAAFAQTPYVRFEGTARSGSFDFGPDPTGDLFRNMKDMMPGETRTQPIRVENNARDGAVLVLYLRSDWKNGADTLRLKPWLTVTYTQQDGSGFTPAQGDAPTGTLLGELRTDTAPQPDISQWVFLGTLEPGGWAELNAQVTLSPEADNTAANGTALVDLWVQAIFPDLPTPDAPDAPEGGILHLPGLAPQTGDPVQLPLLGAAALTALLVLVLTERTRRKNKEM